MRGRLRLAGRLMLRDLRHRPATGLLVLVALLAATTTMTLALMLKPAAEKPWDATFAATNGPHLVATTFDADAATDAAMAELAARPDVVVHAGPYPLLSMPDGFEVMGRDIAPATVDQPVLTSGQWIRDGGIVMEESFARSLGLKVGDRFMNLTIVGIGVTTSRQPTPFYTHGLIWATRADTDRLAPAAESRGSVLMLRLSNPDSATSETLLDELYVDDWRSTRDDAITDALFALFGLIVGSVSLALLAAASVAVALAGRLASQARRAAVLKAVGATRRFIVAVTIAEHAAFAVAAGVAGLVAGALLTPVLADPVPGILGAAHATVPPPSTIALVIGAATVLVGLPALMRLGNPAKPPRRSRLAIALSRRMPAPILLGMRLAARRPGRAILSAAGLSVTVAAVVAALWMEAGIRGDVVESPYAKLRLVTYTFIAALIALALVNAILVSWTTALDNERNSSLARALGATPRQVTAGLTVASLLPALAAVAAGIPAGFAVIATATATAGSESNSPTPAAVGLLALLPATLLAVTFLTAIPSHLATRRPAIDALRTD